mmetsp:Transcript_45274/g.119647  ORF Transcript_45274/g.119647 Transcript_45274/m.119647 type:complete len:208 (-) Transcript_45274:93-716(-)
MRGCLGSGGPLEARHRLPVRPQREPRRLVRDARQRRHDRARRRGRHSRRCALQRRAHQLGRHRRPELDDHAADRRRLRRPHRLDVCDRGLGAGLLGRGLRWRRAARRLRPPLGEPHLEPRHGHAGGHEAVLAAKHRCCQQCGGMDGEHLSDVPLPGLKCCSRRARGPHSGRHFGGGVGGHELAGRCGHGVCVSRGDARRGAHAHFIA